MTRGGRERDSYVDPASPIDPNASRIRSRLHDCDSLLRTANPNRL